MKILKLKGKMVERGMNVEALAANIRMDRATLYRKMNSCEKITIGEARRIKAALKLSDEEALDIFFG